MLHTQEVVDSSHRYGDCLDRGRTGPQTVNAPHMSQMAGHHVVKLAHGQPSTELVVLKELQHQIQVALVLQRNDINSYIVQIHCHKFVEKTLRSEQIVHSCLEGGTSVTQPNGQHCPLTVVSMCARSCLMDLLRSKPDLSVAVGGVQGPEQARTSQGIRESISTGLV
jgi:hypothetical protein